MSDPADSSVEEALTGTWIVVSPDGDESSYLNVIPFNEHEYYGEIWEPGNEDELVRMGIFTTRLNGVWFANIRCLGCDEDDGVYFIFRYDQVADDELVAVSINTDLYEEISELESMEAVRSYVLNHMEDADFFDDEQGRYQKLDDWVWPWETVD